MCVAKLAGQANNVVGFRFDQIIVSAYRCPLPFRNLNLKQWQTEQPTNKTKLKLGDIVIMFDQQQQQQSPTTTTTTTNAIHISIH